MLDAQKDAGASAAARATTYAVKTIYYTLQGEGAQAGRAAVFLRFSGCNLWSGREQDRAAAICQFCDTQFWGTDGPRGGRFAHAEALARVVAECWPAAPQTPETPRLVVCTGGEPLLQLDDALVAALHREGFEVAVETNGTRHAPELVDWICVSPKAGTEILQQHGNELKLVYPQPGVDPADFLHLDFDHFFLQPMDGADREANTRAAIEYCLANPRWRLGLQQHKLLGLP